MTDESQDGRTSQDRPCPGRRADVYCAPPNPRSFRL